MQHMSAEQLHRASTSCVRTAVCCNGSVENMDGRDTSKLLMVSGGNRLLEEQVVAPCPEQEAQFQLLMDKMNFRASLTNATKNGCV